MWHLSAVARRKKNWKWSGAVTAGTARAAHRKCSLYHCVSLAATTNVKIDFGKSLLHNSNVARTNVRNPPGHTGQVRRESGEFRWRQATRAGHKSASFVSVAYDWSDWICYDTPENNFFSSSPKIGTVSVRTAEASAREKIAIVLFCTLPSRHYGYSIATFPWNITTLIDTNGKKTQKV